MEVLCDSCADPFPEEETQTCVCGKVVCDQCFERGHYECADDKEKMPDVRKWKEQ